MSMLDLQGLDFPSGGYDRHGHGHDGDHKGRSHSKKRNKSCYSRCCGRHDW